jgi:transposase
MNKKRAVKNIVRKLARRRQMQRKKQHKKQKKNKKGNKIKHNYQTKTTKNKTKLAKKSDSSFGAEAQKRFSVDSSPQRFLKRRGSSKYYDKKMYDTIKDLPILMAIGKGNGNLTISNVKGSGPKGPIKTIIKELSKLILVILVDEYRTSQLCSECGEKLCHPKTKHYKNKDDNGGEIDKEGKVQESYRLCCCPNSKCHKIWNRDCNASISINKVMSLKLTGKDLGNFSRGNQKSEIKNKKSNVKCTQEVYLKRKQSLNKRISKKFVR